MTSQRARLRAGRILIGAAAAALVALVAGFAVLGRVPAQDVGLRAYVSNEDSDDISVIDLTRGEVVATIPIGKRPRGLRVSPDGRTLYVAVSGSAKSPPGTDPSTLPPPDRSADGIAVVDLARAEVVRVMESGTDPEAFDLSPDGRLLWVSNEDAGETSVVDVATGRVLHRMAVGGEPEGVTTRPDGEVVYVTSEEDHHVAVIDAERHVVLARVPTGERPRTVVFTPDGARAFVTAENGSAVTVIDARAHRARRTIHIPDPGARPMGAAITPDGATLLVSNGRGGTVTVIDVAREEVVGSIPAVGARPWGAAVTPDGRSLLVACGPADGVAVIDLSTRQVRARIPVGQTPWGVAIGPARR
jgi:YVTN family beta-propeller protein